MALNNKYDIALKHNYPEQNLLNKDFKQALTEKINN